MNAQFDNHLKRALGSNGDNSVDPFAPSEEESLFRQAMHLFQGHRKRISILVVIWMIGLMALAVFSALRFFQVESTRDLLLYGLLFFFAIVSISLLKVWSWMQMDKYTILREIKRLELQIACLAQARKADE